MSDFVPSMPRLGPVAQAADYTDPVQEEKRKAEADMREARLRSAEHALISTQAGREWLWGLLASTQLFDEQISLTGAETVDNFFAGKQSIGKGLMRRFCRQWPAEWAVMVQENDR